MIFPRRLKRPPAASSRYVASIIITALLCGCGFSQSPTAPPTESAPPPSQSSQRELAASATGASWIKPGTPAQDLLYVTNYSYVSIYTYPQGKAVGQLTGFHSTVGVCVDNTGDVFVTNQAPTRVYEYAHGRDRRIAELKTHVGPVGCAIDPTTGNLAVAGFSGAPPGPGVDIFKSAKGRPSFYKAPMFFFTYFCGYDDKGDLFVDGEKNPEGDPMFAEVPKGGKRFVEVKLDATIDSGGGVQWDGSHIAIGAYIPPKGTQSKPVIYRFAIAGTRGKRVGTTALGSPAYNTSFQFVISHGTVVVPNWYFVSSLESYNVLFYKYPAGGSPTMILSKGVVNPRGAAISRAPQGLLR